MPEINKLIQSLWLGGAAINVFTEIWCYSSFLKPLSFGLGFQ